MLRGTAKDKVGTRCRMPDRSPPLSEAIIKKFETWIAEGATFDGDDPGAQLDFLLRVITASKATHEELSKMRLDLAKKNWGLGNPGVTPVIIEEDDFRIVGDLAPARMQEVAEHARSIQAKVASALKVKSDKGPMYKGKLTVFLLNKCFEYSEFGQMVEKRELSSELSGHFNYNVVDGYVAILASQENDANIPLLLAEGFAGSYIETLGRNIPRWYSVGSGRVTASRMEARSPLVKQWDDSIAGAMSSGIKLPQLLMAKQVDAAGAVVSYALVRSMVGRGGANQTLVDSLRKGLAVQPGVCKGLRRHARRGGREHAALSESEVSMGRGMLAPGHSPGANFFRSKLAGAQGSTRNCTTGSTWFKLPLRKPSRSSDTYLKPSDNSKDHCGARLRLGQPRNPSWAGTSSLARSPRWYAHAHLA